jgi:hypothetical protein
MDQDKFNVLFVLGIIGTVIACALVFWGTVAAVAIHFIHKFW